MFSRCPHCDKQRQVSAKQLRDSRGLLKCKRCGQSFDALASLSEKGDQARTIATSHSDPSFGGTEARQSPWPWGIASLLMFGILFAQIGYFEGQRLYSQPVIHAALSQACQVIGCRPPLADNPDEWSVSHTELQAHLDNRYLVVAALTNQALVAQAIPKLKLTLTDFNGQTLAERVFAPRQYAAFTELAGNETVEIRLPFIIAASEVGGFTLTTL